ncbi:MAG: chitobiase/beta-hexosaminidase C-terminal domain-containing protein [Planctomycetes bacterium]|nr:chitobiase/beta-hexosaminidase C-terminal domain-containing protein [Planctomycetota bacterium]
MSTQTRSISCALSFAFMALTFAACGGSRSDVSTAQTAATSTASTDEEIEFQVDGNLFDLGGSALRRQGSGVISAVSAASGRPAADMRGSHLPLVRTRHENTFRVTFSFARSGDVISETTATNGRFASNLRFGRSFRREPIRIEIRHPQTNELFSDLTLPPTGADDNDTFGVDVSTRADGTAITEVAEMDSGGNAKDGAPRITVDNGYDLDGDGENDSAARIDFADGLSVIDSDLDGNFGETGDRVDLNGDGVIGADESALFVDLDLDGTADSRTFPDGLSVEDCVGEILLLESQSELVVPGGSVTVEVILVANENGSPVGSLVTLSTEAGTFLRTGTPARTVTVEGSDVLIDSAGNAHFLATIVAPSQLESDSLALTAIVGKTAGNFSRTLELAMIENPGPTLTSVSTLTGTLSGAIGSQVVISGKNLANETDDTEVRFGGSLAEIVSESSASLTVTIPADAVTGPLSVAVGGQVALTDSSFSVLPGVSAITPENGGAGVSPSSSIIATFSEKISGIDASTFILEKADGTDVPASVSPESESDVYTLTPEEALDPLSSYVVRVLPVGFVSAFLTGEAPDVTGPSLVSVSPENGSSGVAPGQIVTLTFSEPVNPYSAQTQISISSEGAIVTSTMTFSQDFTQVVLTPFSTTISSSGLVLAGLAGGRTFGVSVGAGLTDFAGNSVSATQSASFGTRAAISHLFPPSGRAGQEVTIYGGGFSESSSGNVVNVGNVLVTPVASGANQVTFVYPESAGSASVSVTTGGNTTEGVSFTLTALLDVVGYASAGQLPSELACSPLGTTAVVTDESRGRLIEFDAETGTATGRALSLVGLVTDLLYSADGSTIYAANFGTKASAGGSVFVIDSAKMQITGSISVGKRPVRLALSSDGGTLFATNYADDTLAVIDLETLSTAAFIRTGKGPNGIGISPDGSKGFVANYFDGTLTIFDPETQATGATIRVGSNPARAEVSPGGLYVLVTNYGDGTISVIDTRTERVTKTLSLGIQPVAIAFTPSGDKAYVTTRGQGAVRVLSLNSEGVTLESAGIGAGRNPSGIAVTPDGTRLMFSNRGDGKVQVVFIRDIAPTISSLSRKFADVGGTVEIYGLGFSYDAALNTVKIGSVTQEIDADASSRTKIRFTVGTGATSGLLRVISREQESNPVYFEVGTGGPTIQSVRPFQGAANVILDAQIELRFSEPLSASSVTASSIRVTDSEGSVIEGTRALGPEKKKVIFTPTSAYPSNSLISVTINSLLLDPDGNSFDSDTLLTGAQSFTSTFRTTEVVFTPPSISDFTPRSGAFSGGTQIEITGTNFGAGTIVYIGGRRATEVSVSGETQIAAVVPALAGSGSTSSNAVEATVRVVNPDGLQGTASSKFIYLPPVVPLSVERIQPSVGPIAGGTAIKIHGSGFSANTVVSFGDVPAQTVTLISPVELEVTVPAAPAGTRSPLAVNVTVATGAKTSTLALGFRYAPAPTINRLLPSTIEVTGGIVEIRGNYFVTDSHVFVNDQIVYNLDSASAGTPDLTFGVVKSSSLIELYISHIPDGNFVVRVVNPDGQTSNQVTLTAVAPAPTVSLALLSETVAIDNRAFSRSGIFSFAGFTNSRLVVELFDGENPIAMALADDFGSFFFELAGRTSDGGHSFRAVIRENETVVAISVPIVVSVDSTPPEVHASPAGGNFQEPVSVDIISSEPGQTYFSLIEADRSTFARFTDPLTISSATELRFFAVDRLGNESEVRRETYTFVAEPQPPTLTVTPGAGVFETPITVEIVSGDPEADIRYTLDGSTPTQESTAYTGPFYLEADVTIHCIAFGSNGLRSDEAVWSYSFDYRGPSVHASPPGGEYGGPVEVTVTCDDESATIYYASEETNGLYHIYNGPITVSTNQTLALYAIDRDGKYGPYIYEVYYIDTVAPTVTASHEGGTYNAPITVFLDSSDPNATIYYTTDGSVPTTTSTIYNPDGLHLSATTLLKFFAIDSANNASAIQTIAYQFAGQSSISGTVISATDSSAVSGASVELYIGDTVSGNPVQTITTGNEGAFVFSGLTQTTYTYRASRTGYFSAIASVSLDGVSNAIVNPLALSPIVVAGQYRIVLTWGETPGDLDAHLVGPMSSGSNFHVYYSQEYSPDEYVSIDNDDTDSYGPETITVTNFFSGTYRYQVNNYSSVGQLGNVTLGNSGAVVEVYDDTGLVATFSATEGAVGTLWDVFTLDGATKEITVVDAYMTAVETRTETSEPILALSVTPSGGTFSSAQTVTANADNAQVYYTTNGSAPTNQSNVYEGPIAISATTTLKVRAIDSRGYQSSVVTNVYTIDVTPPELSASPAGGEFGDSVTVSIVSSENAYIYYTLDGSTPTISSPYYYGPFTIAASATLKFYGVDYNGNVSGVSAEVYDIVDNSAPVTTASPQGGYFNQYPSVTLEASESATIYYTTDGSTPTIESTVYTTAIVLESTATLKFFAVDGSNNAENVNTEEYIVDADPPTVSADVKGGTYQTPVTVTLTADETSAIHYTLDGSTPTSFATVYVDPIFLNSSATLKFIAIDLASNASEVGSETYVIDVVPPDDPFLSAYSQQTESSSVTPTTALYVNISDGSAATSWMLSETQSTMPTAENPNWVTVKPSSFTLSSGDGVKTLYLWIKDEFELVNVGPVSIAITLDTTPPTVYATPPGGTYGAGQTVSLYASENATIYYTVDNSTPTLSSSAYAVPIDISSDTTLKFFARDTAQNSGSVSSEAYTFDFIAPTAISITTLDLDADGSVDSAKFVMSENVLDSTANPQVATIGGVVATGFDTGEIANDNIFTITLAGAGVLGTDPKDVVTSGALIEDMYGNPMPDLASGDILEESSAGPVLLSAVSSLSLSGNDLVGGTTITLTFSEGVTVDNDSATTLSDFDFTGVNAGSLSATFEASGQTVTITFASGSTLGDWLQTTRVTMTSGQQTVKNSGGYAAQSGNPRIIAGLGPRWTGTANANWSNASNWSVGTAPDASSVAYVPAGTPIQPQTAPSASILGLIVDSGATLTFSSGTFSVYGDIYLKGSVAGSGELYAYGTGSEIEGNIPVTSIYGSYSCSGTVSSAGLLTVMPGGSLLLGGNSVSVGSLTVRLNNTSNKGLRLLDESDELIVTGNATFTTEYNNGSATSNGSYVAGTIRFRGNFTQSVSSYGSGYAFISTGTKVVFDGSNQQNVSFANPGLTSSRFADFELNNAAGLYFSTNTYITGNATLTNGNVTSGGGGTVYLGGNLADPVGNRWQASITNFFGTTTNLPAGVVSAVTVSGTMSLPRDFTATGNLLVSEGATLTLSGNTLNVSGTLTNVLNNVAGTGIVMTNALDLIYVQGNATFTGGYNYGSATSAGNYTDGTIHFRGNFTMNASSYGTHKAFISTGTHVIFDGNVQQTISFSSSSTIDGRFSTIEVNNAAGVYFSSAAHILSDFTCQSGDVTSASGVITLHSNLFDASNARWKATNTTLDNAAQVSFPSSLDSNLTILNEVTLSGSLNVLGNLTISEGATFTLGGNSVTVDGTFTNTLNNVVGSGLVMTNALDVLTLQSNATFTGGYNYGSATSLGNFTAGEIHFRGNFTMNASSYGTHKAFISTGTHVIFDGSVQQTISMSSTGASDGRFYSVDFNNVAGCYLSSAIRFSEDVTCLAGDVTSASGAATLKTNLIDASNSRWKVTNTTLDNALTTSLTTYMQTNLTIVGEIALSNSIEISGSLTISEGAKFTLGGNTVTVGTNFTCTISNSPGTGLIMTNAMDSLVIQGNATFSVAYNNGTATSSGNLTAGTIQLFGNFTQSQASYGSAFAFVSTGTTVEFVGTSQQTVSFTNPGIGASHFDDVTFSNQAGVKFNTSGAIGGVATIASGTVSANSTSIEVTLAEGLVDSSGSAWTVSKTYLGGTGMAVTLPASISTDIYIQDDVLLASNTTVNGNFTISEGATFTLSGHTLAVSGNFAVTLNATANSGLAMTNAADVLDVGGNATFSTGYYQSGATSSGNLSQGVINLAGNFIQTVASGGPGTGFMSSGTKVVFDGSSPQTVSFSNPGFSLSHFDDVEIDNGAGVTFSSDVYVAGLLDLVSGVVTQASSKNLYCQTALPTITAGTYSVTNTRVAGTIAMTENLTLSVATCDIFVDPGYSLSVGAFTLDIGGDLTVEVSNAVSDGLRLLDSLSVVIVHGNATFTTDYYNASATSSGNFVAGEIHFEGNFTQTADSGGTANGFISTGTKAFFDGTNPQTVSMYASSLTASRFVDVEIANAAGVTLNSSVRVTGTLEVTATGALNQTSSYATYYKNALPLLSGGTYSVAKTRVEGNIALSASVSFSETVNDLYVDLGYSLDLATFSLSVPGNLVVEISNTAGDGLKMTQSGCSAYVTGNATFLTEYYNASATSEGNFAAGDFYIYGDFTATADSGGTANAFISTGTVVHFADGQGPQSVSLYASSLSGTRFKDVSVENTAGTTFVSNVRVTGTITVNTGASLTQSSTYATYLSNALPVVNGSYTVAKTRCEGNIVMSYSVFMTDPACSLYVDIGYSLAMGATFGFTLEIGGNLFVEVSNTIGDGLIIDKPDDNLIVHGNCEFRTEYYNASATSEGNFTDGKIYCYGTSFVATADSGGTAKAFISTGTQVYLQPQSEMTVTMYSSSAVASRFGGLFVNNGGTVTFSGNVYVDAAIELSGSSVVGTTGGTLTVAGISANSGGAATISGASIETGSLSIGAGSTINLMETNTISFTQANGIDVYGSLNALFEGATTFQSANPGSTYWGWVQRTGSSLDLLGATVKGLSASGIQINADVTISYFGHVNFIDPEPAGVCIDIVAPYPSLEFADLSFDTECQFNIQTASGSNSNLYVTGYGASDGTTGKAGPNFDNPGMSFNINWIQDGTATVVTGLDNPDANAAVEPNAQGFTMMQFLIKAGIAEDTTIDQIVVASSGSGHDVNELAPSGVSLVEDVNGNGVYDSGTDIVLGTPGTYSADDGTVIFSGLSYTIPSGATKAFIVIYNFSSAVTGNGFAASIADGGGYPDLTLTSSADNPRGTIVSGAAMTIG